MLTRVITIDCQYTRPQFAAAYLVRRGDEALFIDNNTAHSVPLLLEALAREGLKPEAVRYVVITHVHLDHAGGTSTLMRACPRAVLLGHPRAIKHMVDPSKLVASAKHVYGEAEFARLYGEISAIESARVREVGDEQRVDFGGLSLRFMHTRGHANHHACVEITGEAVDPSIFTGDAFGLAYPVLQKRGLFVFPSTSPTDFDPVEARASVARIVGTGCKFAYPTHFGALEDLAGAGAQLAEWLDFSEALLDDAVASGGADSALDAFCEARLRARMAAEFARRGLAWDAGAQELLRMDLELNAQGIAHVARKRRAEA